jgi:hypothetical protein
LFHPLIEVFKERMIVLGVTSFHAKAGDPVNLKLCRRGTWNERMVIETVFSMLTVISHLKKVMHRVAAFNLLVQWHSLTPDENRFVPLSMIEFSL